MRIYGLRYGVATCLISVWILVASPARADDNKEYLVKAAFIYNFVKFVEWPDGRAINQQSSIDICVLGNSGLSTAGAVFKQASTAKLELKLVQDNDTKTAAGHCHIVFIGRSEAGRISSVLAGLKSQPVLTVSDIDDFAENGGMVGFTMQDGKVKLIVNTKAASAAGMRIDAQLLEIALKVIR